MKKITKKNLKKKEEKEERFSIEIWNFSRLSFRDQNKLLLLDWITAIKVICLIKT